ncbi:photosystem II reaction center protein N [Nodularia sp. NIES-3585]|nr:photosystem II reaction center protein N [Nodularia sp. NIES-3585]
MPSGVEPQIITLIINPKFMEQLMAMEPATIISISVGAALVAVTGYAIYMSFGPPSKQLADPFEDHED